MEHIAQVESRHFLGAGQWVGRRVPYHCTAVGKVLLAFEAARAGAGRAAGAAHLAHDRRPPPAGRRARAASAATASPPPRTSWSPGLTALASPVFDRDGTAVAALAVSGPTLRLSPRRIDELRPTVIKQARALSEQLGHRHEGVHAA